jgi:hypothetical protein
MSGTSTPGKPGDTPAKAAGGSVTPGGIQAPVKTSGVSNTIPRVETPRIATAAAQRMVKCPKCGMDAREVARFCPRCHATLRYECPACKHEQRKGGSCEKCSVDFAKYVTAVVAGKQIEADQIHDRIERRTGIIKQVFLLPITGGLSLIRYLLKRSRN